MELDEILLTEQEFTKAYEGATNNKTGWSTRMEVGRAAQNKAQCLKLLEWLKEPCKGHDYIYNRRDTTYTEVPLDSIIFDGKEIVSALLTRHMKDTIRFECPECMSEIESILEG